MATRRFAVGIPTLSVGIIAATLIIGVALLSFSALWIYAPYQQSLSQTLSALYHDPYLRHVIAFTCQQALLSTLISVFPAIFIALAFYRRHFFGRRLLLRLYAMTLVLPVLVAIFGILTIYGNQGWLIRLLRSVNLDINVSIYGLQGILIAHAFFNLPLASRLFLQTLETIAPEQKQLSAQLGMTTFQRFRFLEWPVLKRQLLPTASLIFMLCFASFAVVLLLGGGPKATTIELAIYQALRYDFDLAKAAVLAIIQFLFCLLFMLFSVRLNSVLPVNQSYDVVWHDPQDNRWLKCWDYFLIIIAALFILPPLLAVIVNGLNSALFTILMQAKLWQSIFTSLYIALGAALLSLSLTLMLLWTSREISTTHYYRWAKRLELSGMLILAMPAIVLATGFFLFFINTTGLPENPALLIILINGLMAIPYTLKVLTIPMYNLSQRYRLICQSLGLSGLNRLKWVEFRALRKPLLHAFAFASLLSIGDFGVIALFGHDGFTTLPYYLYEQLSAYRSQYGAVTALILLLFCFILFSIIERLADSHD